MHLEFSVLGQVQVDLSHAGNALILHYDLQPALHHQHLQRLVCSKTRKHHCAMFCLK